MCQHSLPMAAHRAKPIRMRKASAGDANSAAPERQGARKPSAQQAYQSKLHAGQRQSKRQAGQRRCPPTCGSVTTLVSLPATSTSSCMWEAGAVGSPTQPCSRYTPPFVGMQCNTCGGCQAGCAGAPAAARFRPSDTRQVPRQPSPTQHCRCRPLRPPSPQGSTPPAGTAAPAGRQELGLVKGNCQGCRLAKCMCECVQAAPATRAAGGPASIQASAAEAPPLCIEGIPLAQLGAHLL